MASSVVTFSPPMWNSGAAVSVMSSGFEDSAKAALTLFHSRLPWVSMAPFGRPVVPEVYMMTAVSWGEAAMCPWYGSLPASRSW